DPHHVAGVDDQRGAGDDAERAAVPDGRVVGDQLTDRRDQQTHGSTAVTPSASALPMSGTCTCTPPDTTGSPATTTWWTSAAVAANTATSGPVPVPAVRGESSRSDTRSAGAPGRITPPEGR